MKRLIRDGTDPTVLRRGDFGDIPQSLRASFIPLVRPSRLARQKQGGVGGCILRPELFSLIFTLAFVFVGGGCKTGPEGSDVPEKKPQTTAPAPTPKAKEELRIDPVVVQQKALRFADEFYTRTNLSISQLRRGGVPLPVAEALNWKIALGTTTCSIASGANAIANLIDLTVLATVTRAAVEVEEQSNEFGESIQPFLIGCRQSEAEAWQLAGTILNAAQQAELRQAIDRWLSQNPPVENILAARALGFTAQFEDVRDETKQKPGSVFGLLKLDPLAGMDPAVRELAQSRLFAERALFVAQKMPQLLRWQMELLTANALTAPTFQQLVANTTELTVAVERVSRLAEALPDRIEQQREEIMHALDAQEKKLTPLVAEVRQTLGTGRDMSNSLNTTFETFDALMKRFGVGEPARPQPPGPPEVPGPPFRILDYTETAAQLEKTAHQLTELLAALDQTLGSPNLAQLSSQVTPAVQQAKIGSKEIVDYVFLRSILLVIAVLAAMLIYRFLNTKLTATQRAHRNFP